MKKLAQLILVLAVLIAAEGAAWAATVDNLRFSSNPSRVRIVLDADGPVVFKSSRQNNTIALDLDAELKKPQTKTLTDSVVKGLSLEKNGKAKSRLVVSLGRNAQYKAFTLKNPNRVIIDIYRIAIIKNTREEGKGLKYTFWQDDMKGLPVKMHIVEVAPQGDFYVKPFSAAISRNGRGRLGYATRVLGAKAAVNASYFDTSGWVIGNCKWQEDWYGIETTPRSGLAIDPQGKPSIIQDMAYKGTALLPDNSYVTIQGLNRERIANDCVLYTSTFGTATGTNEFGCEVRLVNNRVTEKSLKGNMKLQSGSVVLSGHGVNAEALKRLRVGDRVKLSQTLGSREADEAKLILGAGPSLLNNGRVAVRSEAERIAPDIRWGRAPRTGVGVKADGSLLLMVVDGRSSASAGMTLVEFADYFRRLGAVQALNFDGGGSSEMVLNGKIMNSPSDGAERPVSIGLGVFTR